MQQANSLDVIIGLGGSGLSAVNFVCRGAMCGGDG